MQNDSSYLKENKSIDKYSKFMATSSYFGNESSYATKISQDKSLNNVKLSNER